MRTTVQRARTSLNWYLWHSVRTSSRLKETWTQTRRGTRASKPSSPGLFLFKVSHQWEYRNAETGRPVGIIAQDSSTASTRV